MAVSKNIKLLQKELKRAGADKRVVREWIKLYQKINKKYPKVKGSYDTERAKLVHLQNLLKHMEASFVAGGDVKTALKQDVALLKQVKEFAGHEFLVDKGNTEFALTFSRLKTMTASLKKISEKDMLFLHSEIENLSDMIKEILENKMPNLHALTFFLMNYSENQLKELPYDEKLRKVEQVYKQRFCKPMEEVLSVALEKGNGNMPILSANGDKIKEERIDYIMEEWIWK
jgi:hypothetical protein